MIMLIIQGDRACLVYRLLVVTIMVIIQDFRIYQAFLVVADTTKSMGAFVCQTFQV